MFLVETGESRTLKEALPIVDALRDLSEALARLADTFDEASSNQLKPRRAVSLMGTKYWPDGTW